MSETHTEFPAVTAALKFYDLDGKSHMVNVKVDSEMSLSPQPVRVVDSYCHLIDNLKTRTPS